MGWFQQFVGRLAKRAAKYAGIPLRDPALVQMLGSQPTSSGVDVDENLATNLSSIWAGATLISTSLAAMPAIPHEVTSSGDYREAVECPAWKMLLIAPNPEMTPFVFHQTLQYHALLWGNGYARTDKAMPDSMATQMWLLMPNQVEPIRDEKGEICYQFTALFEGEEDELIPWWQVVHIPGLSFDGLKGYHLVDQARESIGLAIAAEKFGGAFFGRGCTPYGIIEYPDELRLTKRARANLRESFELLHRGPDNSHRIMILEQGMTYKQTAIPPNASQFLETRKFQVTEIARWLNIPPHKLRDLDRATFSNIEHQSIEFLQDTMRPWMLKFAEEYRRKLFGPYDQTKYCVRHRTHNLLMTDMNTRFDAYGKARNGGWYTLNDIMSQEGMPKLPPEIGDVRLAPSTMRTLGPDPAAPVDPLVMQAAIRTVSAMRPLDPACAVSVLRAFMPQASDTLIQSLVEKLDVGGTNPQMWAVADDQAKSATASTVVAMQQAVYDGKVPKEAGIAAVMVILGLSEEEAGRMFP